jgi:hypothetical protein
MFAAGNARAQQDQALHATWYPYRLEQHEPARPAGPFKAQSVAFYVVHHGGPLAVTLIVNRPDAEIADNGGIRFPHAVFWQAFDHEERPVDRRTYRFETPDERGRRFTVEFEDTAPGVYQVRAAKTAGNSMTFDLETKPACSVAVMPVRCRLGMSGRDQFADAYVYAPPGTGEVRLHSYAAKVELMSLDGTAAGASDLDGGRCAVVPGTVYRLRATPTWEASSFGLSGMPPILCADPDTARNIRGSVEIAPDGRILHHRFQLRMWEWMHSLTADDLAVAPADLAALREYWLGDPKNAGLLGITGPFNHIPKILRTQNLEPDSPEYGKGICASWLGPAYVIDKPFNPYRRNPAVLNRLLLYEFAVYLGLAENGTFSADNWNHYSGGDGLTYGKRGFQFGYVAPHMEDSALRDLWFEGVSRPLDRWAFSRVSCENQTSSFAAGMYCLYMGSGRDVYKTLAHDFVANLFDPGMNRFFRTGYLQERYGPDATYQGLCTAELAFYFRLSGDETAGLQRIYGLLNHTVAPEPDGTLRGASNFSHRTSGSWVNKQYNAGVALMSGELPEAGVWYTPPPTPEERDAERLEAIERGLDTHWDDEWYEKNMRWMDSYVYHPWLRFFNTYLLPTETIRPGQWPATLAVHSIRDANGEFLFVRKPAYYAAVYTGSTSHKWVRNSVKHLPYHDGWQMEEGVLVPTTTAAKKNAWWPTQGLSMLWTEQAGSLVLGKNWNVYTANIVRADLPDGKVDWPDYWEFAHDLSADRAQLKTRAPMLELPLVVTRELRFTDDGVAQELTLAAGEPVATRRLVEQIPFLQTPETELMSRKGAVWQPGLAQSVDAVWVGKTGDRGMLVAFTAPVRVTRGPTSSHHRQQLGLLEVDLPRSISAGEQATLSYTLSAAPRP